MDFQAFSKWITRKGYAIQPTTNHHKIVDKAGKTIEHFAIHHKEGGKRWVKPYYVSKIRKKIGP